RVKVLDFGLARPVEGAHLTQTGLAVGTPAYMAPEQIGGQAGPRADLFSLGVVLYRTVTGQLPFPRRTSGDVVPRVGGCRPVTELAPAVPVAVAEPTHDLLAVDPAQRPASAEAVAKALGTLADQAGAPPPATVAAAPRPAPVAPPRRRRRLLLAACAAAL